MAKYIIKNNLPNEFLNKSLQHTLKDKKEAILVFKDIVEVLYIKSYPVKVTFQKEPLRGTIQVEIDGFYYYVELYKE